MKSKFWMLLMVSSLLLPGCGKEGSHEDETSDHDGHTEKGGHGHEEGMEEVHIKKESQQLIGLQKVKVQKAPLTASIEVAGEIAQETENVAYVTSPKAGTLQAYKVNLGDTVEKDTPLFSVKTQTGDLDVKAPSHGIVLTQHLKEGDSLDTLTSVVTIADPDILRASFNVYEKDLAGIAVGQEVVTGSITYPNQKFKGRIVFISPRVDETSRTIKIRADIENEEHLLKLGMFVTGEILIPVKDDALVLPLDAIQEVEGQNVVFVPNPAEEDAFFVRPVRLGQKTKKQVEILEGLKEGDEVVGKGSFYLKTELQKEELEEGHAH